VRLLANLMLKVKMNRDIFCPFCTNQLVRQNDNLYCEKGDCGFSKVVQNLMEEALSKVDLSKPIDPILEKFNYYCPNCRGKLEVVDEDKSFLCNNCSLKIRSGFGHMLREYHYHKKENL
jgi:ribosomal protein L37AE/L43A